MTKRFRLDGENIEVESMNVANVLMLLARSEHENGRSAEHAVAPPTQHGRVFECKTCNRSFPSFQALGGHRASHKKPRTVVEAGVGVVAKPKAHECSVCGLEFAIGQALGGHMRRHRAAEMVEKKVEEEGGGGGGRRGVWLDLNLPPAPAAEGEVEWLKLGSGEKISRMVDCFH